MRYTRDMRGFGPNPPKANWPNNAKIAIQIVLNYEEGGENCILHGDAASEAFLSEIVGAAAWPDQRHWNMESIYEYGARAGFWRLFRLFQDRNIPVTVFGVATALARSPEQVGAMLSENWEVACHGLKWIEHKDMPADEEAAQIKEAIRLHTEVIGERPQGWYTGRCSVNTVPLVAREGGFSYISDSYADDLPYWVEIDGQDQLIVPYALDANDMRFATPQGFNTSDHFFSYLKDSFDALYAEGAEGDAKMMSIGLHCRLIGRPGRVMGLKRFIEYAQSHAHVWFARRVDIAKHWHKTYPPKTMERPSQMSKARFVALYEGVFEHSPWIAAAAHDLELGTAHDCASGVHNALTRVFRSASAQQRLEVLRAHPDLAGTLALTARLTEASTNEQASVGLDALTDAERGQFETLNAAYVEKHGFPFIIAVRDHSKAEILNAFQSRIKNDSATEIDTACRQVERIAELRLKDLF